MICPNCKASCPATDARTCSEDGCAICVRCKKKHEGSCNATSNMWREHKEHLKEVREKSRDEQAFKLDALLALGFEVESLTAFQYRVNSTLDIYPTNRRYHNIKTGKRGRYHDLIPFITSTLQSEGATNNIGEKK